MLVNEIERDSLLVNETDRQTDRDKDRDRDRQSLLVSTVDLHYLSFMFVILLLTVLQIPVFTENE